MRIAIFFLCSFFIISLECTAQLAPQSYSSYFTAGSSLTCKNLSTLPQSLAVSVFGSDGSTVSSSPLVIAAYEASTVDLPKDLPTGSVVVTSATPGIPGAEVSCNITSTSTIGDGGSVRDRHQLEPGHSGNSYFAGTGGSELRILNSSGIKRTFKVNIFNANGSLDYSKSNGSVPVGANGMALIPIDGSNAGTNLVEIIPDSVVPYSAWTGNISAAQASKICGAGQGATFMLRGKERSKLSLSNSSDAPTVALLELKDIGGNVSAQTDVELKPKSSQQIDLSQFTPVELGQSPAATVDLKCTGSGKLVGVLSTDSGTAIQPQLLGNLRAGSNGLYEFRGKDLLMVGDSVSQAFSELGSDFNYNIYLQLLKERGIGAFMIWSYIAGNNQLTDERIGYAAPRIFPWINEGGGASLQFSYVNSFGRAVFNEGYFDRLEELVSNANEKGIVVVVTVHDGWAKTRFDGHPMNQRNGGFISNKDDYVRLASYSEQQPDIFNPAWSNLQKHQFVLEQFTKRLVDTVAGYPNVALEVFNEGEWYDEKSLIAFQQHFSRLIRERSALPIVINRNSQNDPVVSTSEVSGLSIHSPRWSTRTLAAASAKQIARYTGQGVGAKPVLFTEPVPEYRGRDTESMVRLMWGSLMAKAGFFVPNDTLWKISLTSAPDPIFVAIGTASKLFNQAGIDIGRMVMGSSDDCGGNACLMVPQEEYLIYYEGREQIELNLNGPPGATYSVRFVNPLTGQIIAQEAPISAGGIVNIQPPTADEDWLVWVKRI